MCNISFSDADFYIKHILIRNCNELKPHSVRTLLIEIRSNQMSPKKSQDKKTKRPRLNENEASLSCNEWKPYPGKNLKPYNEQWHLDRYQYQTNENNQFFRVVLKLQSHISPERQTLRFKPKQHSKKPWSLLH